MPLVLHVNDAVGLALIVAPGDPADPIRRVPSQAGNHFGREATGHEPEKLPTAALERNLRAPGASREFLNAQVRFEVDVMPCRVAPL
jgi:hypothetical protein